jgi:hypothetical protein
MPLTVGDWELLIDEMLHEWMPQRSAIVLEQLIAAGVYPQLAAPEFSQYGGEIAPGFDLTMGAPGTIYYTLDGTDPRQSALAVGVDESGIAPGALTYVGPITLQTSVTVKARTFADGEWSALAESDFRTGVPPLRFSEVMYHPLDPEAGQPFTDDDFEFIELLNVSQTAPVNLQGVRLVEGVEFTFPPLVLDPGQHVVIARNRAAFASRYGSGMLVAGEFGTTTDRWTLSDRGESIRLEDATGAVIQAFTYDDAWYPTTDGSGFSLDVRDPAAAGVDLNQESAWLPSIVVGGTPGAARSGAAVRPGDANLDGHVDAADVSAFALGLAAADAYLAEYGVPAVRAGDVDQDNDLDFDDIDDFLTLLAGAVTAAANRDTDAVTECPDVAPCARAADIQAWANGRDTPALRSPPLTARGSDRRQGSLPARATLGNQPGVSSSFAIRLRLTGPQSSQ